MRKNSNMDCRTRQQIQDETINSICELQDAIDALFPWRIAQDDSEIVLSNNTIQLVIKYINQLKEEVAELTLIVRQLRKGE